MDGCQYNEGLNTETEGSRMRRVIVGRVMCVCVSEYHRDGEVRFP